MLFYWSPLIGTVCTAESSRYFIVANRNTIARVGLDGRSHQVLVTGLRNAVAIDYNYRYSNVMAKIRSPVVCMYRRISKQSH